MANMCRCIGGPHDNECISTDADVVYLPDVHDAPDAGFHARACYERRGEYFVFMGYEVRGTSEFAKGSERGIKVSRRNIGSIQFNEPLLANVAALQQLTEGAKKAGEAIMAGLAARRNSQTHSAPLEADQPIIVEAL